MGQRRDPSGLEYRRDIDGLRAVAVLVVVAFHVGLPGASGGYVGVDVFFAISGFLITGLLSDEIARTGSIAFGDFYARRVRRLLPALCAVLLATLLLGALELSPLGEQQALARSALFTAAFASNFHFMQAAGDYFADETSQMPLLHTWSLGVEEQFYVVWPVLLLGFALLARRARLRFPTVAAIALGLVATGSFAAGVRATRTAPLAAFYLTPFRAWEFALGGLLALAPVVPKKPRLAAACVSIGLSAIGLATLAFDPGVAFPGWAALLPVTGALLVVAGGAGPANGPSRFLASRPLVHLGQLSYSWYLWHWPLVVLARASRFGERSLPRDVAAALVALALAELTRRFVENPVRFGGLPAFRRPGAALASGLCLSLAMAGGALLLDRRARELDFVSAGRGPMQPRCQGFAAREDCTLGPWGRVPGLVVWGDSHAQRLTSLAAAFGVEAGVPLLERTDKACPPLLGAVPTWSEGQASPTCGAFNGSVAAEIDELARVGDVRGVILAARWTTYLGVGTLGGGTPRRLVVDGRVLDHAHSLPALHDALAATVRTLQGKGLRVLIVASWPEFPFPLPECVLERGVAACSIPRAQAEADRAEALAVLRAVVGAGAAVRLFDPMDAFCSPTVCAPAIGGGEVMYNDRHHLTHRAAAALLPRARADLRWLAGLER